MIRPLTMAALAAGVVVVAGRLYDRLSWMEISGLAVCAGAWAVVYWLWWRWRYGA